MSSGQSVHEDREGEMGNGKGKEGHTAVNLCQASTWQGEPWESVLGCLGWRSWEHEMDILFGYGYFALLKSVIYKNAKLEIGQVKDWEFVIT